jgi:adenylate kinase
MVWLGIGVNVVLIGVTGVGGKTVFNFAIDLVVLKLLTCDLLGMA